MPSRFRSRSRVAAAAPCAGPRPPAAGPFRVRVVLLSTLVLGTLAACGGGGAGAPTVAAADGQLRIEAAVASGSAGALAAELLRGPFSLRGQTDVEAVAFGQELEAIALDHLRSDVLGPDGGPPLLGSALVRRLAVEPGAPVDQNGIAGNLDETLQLEVERVVAFAGTTPPGAVTSPVLPWRERGADLAAALPPGAEPPPASWGTVASPSRTVAMADVGAFLQARVAAAQRLLPGTQRGVLGRNGRDGTLGLLAMLQFQGAEETLFASLYTSGGALGGLETPRTYDPTAAPRWLPAAVDAESPLPGELTLRTVDGASDLLALAMLMQPASEFVRATRPGGAPELTALFEGRPFKLPSRQPPVEPVPSWSRDIGPLLQFRCGACHASPGQNGFVIDTYQQVLQGGNRTRAFNLTMVVPGDPARSFLHEVLMGPRAPFFRMPFGGPYLPAAEIARIDEWILTGANEFPPEPPPPPQPGEDLARVSFANLVALHFDPDTGALHHRREADGSSGVATALATGHALQALAAVDAALPELVQNGLAPWDVLQRAATFAGERLVDASGQCLDGVPVDAPSPGGAGEPPRRAADLRGQAALTAGLLAAAARSPQHVAVARRAATRLLDAYRDAASPLFADAPGATPSRLDAATLADLLAALRLAAAAGVPDVAFARGELLLRLRPVLAFAEWGDHGEVLGDGVPDGDGDGLREPALAGGAHGRLPLLPAAIVAGDGALAPRDVTWSQHVRPLLHETCGECHFDGNQRGNYHLDTLRLVATPGDSLGALPLLVPGDPAASLLFQKVTSRQPPIGSAMPLQRPPLDDKAVELLRRWIEGGATGR